MKKSTIKPQNKHGGPRPNSGRPKGKKNPDTLLKEAVLAEYRQKVMAKADQLLTAQMALALGSVECFIVEHYKDIDGRTKKRHVRVDDPELMANILDDPELIQGDNYVFVNVVKPDTKTLDSMLDRAFGKATQINELTAKDGADLFPKTTINLNE